MPDSMTQILSSAPPGTKINIAVLGDGFAASADQTLHNFEDFAALERPKNRTI